MKQLTIRGFDEELAHRIERLARLEGISLNQAVLRLLRKGAGIGKRKDEADVVGGSMASDMARVSSGILGSCASSSTIPTWFSFRSLW